MFSEYRWVVPLKDQKGIEITNAFQKLLDDSNCKSINLLLLEYLLEP